MSNNRDDKEKAVQAPVTPTVEALQAEIAELRATGEALRNEMRELRASSQKQHEGFIEAIRLFASVTEKQTQVLARTELVQELSALVQVCTAELAHGTLGSACNARVDLLTKAVLNFGAT